ncbi:MAG: hypothetical protein P4L92_15180 [Rudaea sp.]|nr:hypothetical protein [Rudaea sp.]
MHAAIFRRTISALGALVLFAPVAYVFAQSADATASYAIGVQNGVQDVRASWTLAISGEWATECPPTLEKVALDGATGLRIDARSVLGLCTRRAMPFSIEVNPALALDRGALPAGVYHVSFYAADGAQARPRLRAFALVDRSGAGAARIEPETGFWWAANSNESAAGRTVLSIELQNQQLSVALMSYDASGQPVWHFGAAPYSGRTAHVPLLHLQGGGDPFSAASATPQGDATLTLDLQFQTAAHASAWLSRVEGSADEPSLRLQPLDLARIPLAATADGSVWQGDWVLVDDASTSAQRLRFDHFLAIDADHFELDDGAAGIAMICTRDATRPELPPSACALNQGSGVDASRFDSVAIARMDGTRSNGTAIHLLRVTP